MKIENDDGHYTTTGVEYNTIDKINKEDLMRLIELTLESDVEFDEYSEATIKNHAHQIIYKNIWEKLIGLHARKDEFKDESDRAFLTEYAKYKDETP